jgi:hypothetical protein
MKGHGGIEWFENRAKEVFMFRMLTMSFVAMALAAMSQSGLAAEKSHEGLVVKVAESKLTMTLLDGSKEHSHDITKDTKVTLDEKPAKLEDLKKGFHITVTMDEKVVTKSVAHSKKK